MKKTFGLIATTPQKNAVNVPIFWPMSNGDMAKAIDQEIALNDETDRWSMKQRFEVETFLNSLVNDSEKLFIDPCLGECPDAFVCAFGFNY